MRTSYTSTKTETLDLKDVKRSADRIQRWNSPR
jgi:hypothetical protein